MVLLYKIRNRLLSLIGLTMLYLTFYMLVYYGGINLGDTLNALIVKTLKFHFLLFGCVLGYLYYEHKDCHFMKLMNAVILKIIAILCFILSVGLLPRHIDPHNILGVLVFSWLMLALIEPNEVVHIDWKILAYLGTISYGIYIYHPFVSIGVRFVMQQVNGLNQAVFAAPWLFYMLVLLITVIIAHFSYQSFEKFFLMRKKKYYS